MNQFPARWTSIVAAAALLTLPLSASAQTSAQPESKVDAAAAKEHLTEARDTLKQLTAMPEAARLQGDVRTQVTQLITNFNELITAQTDWRSAYAKVDANLTTVLGPETPDAASASSGVAGAVGTSGAGAADLDPAVRGKLAEFRSHLKAFERAAGGGTPATGAAAAAPSAAAPAAPPAAASSAPAPAPAHAATMVPADQAKVAERVTSAEADKHLDAISALIDRAQTGALTKEQIAELRTHVDLLRALLKK
jgi:hypothetical protein